MRGTRWAMMVALGVRAAWGAPFCSFESDADSAAFRPGAGVTAAAVTEHASQGGRALRVVFAGKAEDSWPGLSLIPPDPDLSAREVLAFDVFNPEGGTGQLSWRVDDAGGGRVFGSAALKPGANTVALYPGALRSQLDATRVKQIYVYVRCPRTDVTLFFDAFRFEALNATFTPLVYEEAGPLAPVTDADRARGYVLFSRHPLDYVFPESRPRVGETNPHPGAFAAPGEYEPLTVSVHALRDLNGLRAEVSDLSRGEARIPAGAVRVYPVRSLDKRVTYSSERYIRNLPVLLENRDRVELASGLSKRFFLDVAVPADAVAGIYTGTVTVRADGVPAATVPVRLRVLPFRLAEPEGLLFGEYYQGPRLARTPEEERAFAARDLADMREHGMTSLGLCVGLPFDRAVLRDDGVADLGWDGTSLFEHILHTCRELGFREPIIQLTDSGQSFAAGTGAVFGTPEYAGAYKAFWVAVQAEGRRRGWPEIVVQPVDEPGWKDESAKSRNVALLKLLKEIPGMRTEQDGPADGYFHGQAGPHADMWNYNGALAGEDVVSRAVADGKTILIYNCDVESLRPETQRYAAGLFRLRSGIHGCFNWAYMSFSGSPYSDFDYKTGTWMHVYPPFEGEVGGPSVGWKGFREGIDDTRYVVTLQRLLADAAASDSPAVRKAADEGRAVLADAATATDFSHRVRGQARWTSTRRDADGVERVSGTLKLPNAPDFAGYDLLRWRVAEAILRLRDAMDGTVGAPVAGGPGPAKIAALCREVTWRPDPAPGPAPETARGRTVSIPLSDAAPEVDGTPAEPAWQGAVSLGDFERNTGGAPDAQTRVRLLRTATMLFAAVECEEEFTDRLTVAVRENGGPVWQDDCIEFFFDGNSDRTTFRQLVINPAGVWLATDSRGTAWKPGVVTAARVGKGHWSCEVGIPLEDLELSAAAFGFNVCRERRPTEVLELSCWSPTGPRFAEPSRFGQATFRELCLGDLALGDPLYGAARATAVVLNPGKTPRSYRLVAEGRTGEGAPQRREFEIADVRPGERRSVEIPYAPAGDDTVFALRVLLLDAVTGETVGAGELAFALPPLLTLRVEPRAAFAGAGDAVAAVGVNAMPDVRDTIRLAIRVLDRESGAEIGSAEPVAVAGAGANAVLATSLLPPGEYVIEIRAVGDVPGTVTRRVSAPFTCVRGPF